MGKILSIGEEPIKIPYFTLLSVILFSIIIAIAILFVYQMRTKTPKEQTFVTLFE